MFIELVIEMIVSFVRENDHNGAQWLMRFIGNEKKSNFSILESSHGNQWENTFFLHWEEAFGENRCKLVICFSHAMPRKFSIVFRKFVYF